MKTLPQRSYWIDKKTYSFAYDGEYLREESDPVNGYLISSLCPNRQHAPLLDLDYPVETDGHDKIFFNRKTQIKYFPGLVGALLSCGYIDSAEACHQIRLYENAPPELRICPAIRLSAPFRLFPSSTPGHFHLYVDKTTSWRRYKNLLYELKNAGLIESGYLDNALKNRKSFLLKQGVSKDDIRRLQAQDKISRNYTLNYY